MRRAASPSSDRGRRCASSLSCVWHLAEDVRVEQEGERHVFTGTEQTANMECVCVLIYDEETGVSAAQPCAS